MEIRTGHKENCTWAEPLPNEFTESGIPCYYGCNCGYDEWYLKNEKILDSFVYIIERYEHGSGGVCGKEVLDFLPLIDAFTKTPYEYGVKKINHPFGFFPIINHKNEVNNFSYYWDDEEEKWIEVSNG